MSTESDQSETRREIKATDQIVNRRGVLLGGTTLAAASALGAGAPMQIALAQAPSTQSKPNILFMLVDNSATANWAVMAAVQRVAQQRRASTNLQARVCA